MKKSRFSEEQIAGVLKESKAGAKTPELCRKHGISPATLYMRARTEMPPGMGAETPPPTR